MTDVVHVPLPENESSDGSGENTPTEVVQEPLRQNESSDGGGENTPKNVRGRPFERGNSGRPRGARNKTTRLFEQLMVDEGESLIRKALELAQGGNVRCIQICLNRILPSRPGRPVDISMPAIEGTRDLVPALAAITNAVADGSLTPEEANQLMKLVEVCASVLKVTELNARVEALEALMKIGDEYNDSSGTQN